ncbi:MAG TPA: hypothetical protein VGG01_10040 [Xanthobacteraceae bacterium]
MSKRRCHSSVGALVLAAAIFAGPAAAQDYDAGKTGPQLFASDCSACHNSPGGLAKGKDKGALTTFLAEHYTSRRESAQLLAAFLLGAGPGDARRDRVDVPSGPKAKPRRAEREEEPKVGPAPEPKPRAEPAKRAEASAETHEEGPKRTRDREPPKGADPVVSKLKYYGSARGPAKDTAHLANPEQRLESYANSGSPSLTPDAGTHDDAAPGSKRKVTHRKKKKDTDTAESTAVPRAPKPAPPQQRPIGNN